MPELLLLVFAGLPVTVSPRRHMLLFLVMPLLYLPLGLGPRTAPLDKGRVRKVQQTEQALRVIFSSLKEGRGEREPEA